MRYIDFTVNDFAMDEYFQSWVFNSGDEAVRNFWETWLLEHPEKRADVAGAKKLLQAVRFSRHELSGDQVSDLWNRIHGTDVEPHESRTGSRFAWMYRVAATIVLIGVAGLVYLLSNDKPWVEYHTTYGETKSITLPDGSFVVLNANSKLTVYLNWNEEPSREIWLDGEAFFSVVHKTNNQPFKVITAEGVTVEVLGTTFNVYNRTNGTKVVLNSGQIRLNLPTEQSPEMIVMKPGEMVEYKEQHYKKKAVNPLLYTAWTNNKIILDHTSLGEMVYMLKDSYGLEVKVSDTKLLDETVSGSMPLGDPEILLTQMAKAFQLKIKKNDNVIEMEEDNELR
ncbi:MAG TPA: FecR domain-containing protein [Chryseolinea sp.]|nr:FecR domain-containing protein [Chryseolinea sp.]